MSSRQRRALRLMRDANIGAVHTASGWIWPHDVRESETAAHAVISTLGPGMFA